MYSDIIMSLSMKRTTFILPLSVLAEKVIMQFDYQYLQIKPCSQQIKQEIIINYIVSAIRLNLLRKLNPTVRSPDGYLNYTNENLLGDISLIWEVELTNAEINIKWICGYEELLEGILTGGAFNDFNVWTISKQSSQYIIECQGDFRILEWERDHMNNGKYSPNYSKRTIDDISDFAEINDFILKNLKS